MRVWGVLLCGLAGPALAQEAAPPGVVSYPAAFFADARPNTALDMIDRLPGFTLDNGSDIRGYAGAAGNVVIDGERPASKTDSITELLRRIPAAQVERIDLIRGGAPGVDMQGKTVIANVARRREGARISGVATVGAQLLADGRVAPQVRLEAIRRKDDRVLELGLFAYDSFGDEDDGPRRVRDGSGALISSSSMRTRNDGGQIEGTAAYEAPIAGGRLRANLKAVSSATRYHATNRPPGGAIDEVQHDDQGAREAEAGLRWTRPVGDRTNLELLALQRFSDDDYRSRFETAGFGARFDLRDERGESIGRAVVRHTLSPDLALEAGAEAAFNWLESRTDYAENGLPIALPAANVRVEEKRAEAFATATWRPRPTLTVEGGLRIERSTIGSTGDVVLEKTLTYPKPRLLVTWAPREDRQLRLRIEREVGQIDFGNFVAASTHNGQQVTAGNPDLAPQQAWVAEAAFERRFWEKGAAVLTLRHARLSDVIDRVPFCTDLDANGCDDLNGDGAPDFFDGPGNVGDGRQTDLALDLTVPLDRFGVPGGLLKAQGAWTWSAVADPTTGEKRRISTQQPFRGEVHFSQELPRWNSRWGVDAWAGGQQRTWRVDRIDTFAWGTFVSAFVEYKPSPRLSLRAEAMNLGSRPTTRTFLLYDGPRDAAPLRADERRDLHWGPILFVSVRRSLP